MKTLRAHPAHAWKNKVFGIMVLKHAKLIAPDGFDLHRVKLFTPYVAFTSCSECCQWASQAFSDAAFVDRNW